MRKKRDWTGTKIGMLTVIGLAGYKKYGFWVWECQCECGNKTYVTNCHLYNGHTKSCGCLRKGIFVRLGINGSVRRKEKGESGRNHIYRAYKGGAKQRNLAFELTKEEFRALTSSDCYYCGSSPKLISYGTKDRMTKEGLEYAAYLYNGIDRIDNTKGYLIDNVVPCCFDCNRMKTDFTLDWFFSKIKTIYEKHVKPKEELNV